MGGRESAGQLSLSSSRFIPSVSPRSAHTRVTPAYLKKSRATPRTRHRGTDQHIPRPRQPFSTRFFPHSNHLCMIGDPYRYRFCNLVVVGKDTRTADWISLRNAYTKLPKCFVTFPMNFIAIAVAVLSLLYMYFFRALQFCSMDCITNRTSTSYFLHAE